MKNLLLVLLTALIVLLGAFLPGFLMERDSMDNVELDYQMVSASAQNTSDYAWRMSTIAEHIYGEGTELLLNYIPISGNTPEQKQELLEEFYGSLEELVSHNVIHSALPALLREVEAQNGFEISSYYVFDRSALNGFQMLILTITKGPWAFSATMDVESGKLAMLDLSGWEKHPRPQLRSDAVVSWYDTLRGFADYLGLADNSFQAEVDWTKDASIREYYEKRTVDRLAAQLRSGSGWLETRALQDEYTEAFCVFRGGR